MAILVTDGISYFLQMALENRNKWLILLFFIVIYFNYIYFHLYLCEHLCLLNYLSEIDLETRNRFVSVRYLLKVLRTEIKFVLIMRRMC